MSDERQRALLEAAQAVIEFIRFEMDDEFGDAGETYELYTLKLCRDHRQWYPAWGDYENLCGLMPALVRLYNAVNEAKSNE